MLLIHSLPCCRDAHAGATSSTTIYETAWREGTLLSINNAVELAADTLASRGETSLS